MGGVCAWYSNHAAVANVAPLYHRAVGVGGSGAIHVGVNVEFPNSSLNNSVSPRALEQTGVKTRALEQTGVETRACVVVMASMFERAPSLRQLLMTRCEGWTGYFGFCCHVRSSPQESLTFATRAHGRASKTCITALVTPSLPPLVMCVAADGMGWNLRVLLY